MAQTAPRTLLSDNEKIALACAVFGHALLLAVLAWQRPGAAPPPPDRMSVTISDESALVSTSPDPTAQPAPDTGPVLGDAPPPEPIEAAKPEPQVQPKPATKPNPPKPTTKPKPQTQQRPNQTAGKPDQRRVNNPGSANLENDIDQTLGGRHKSGGPPAQATGAQKMAWQNSVASRVLGPWQRCPVSGLDLEKLRMVIPFTLDRQGRVISIGEPRISGQTAANRSQIAPFRACAERAIRLAAPYTGLPDQFYDQWKSRELTFSKGRTQ